MKPFTFTPRDLLRLLYMIFFKPISLDRYIHQVILRWAGTLV